MAIFKPKKTKKNAADPDVQVLDFSYTPNDSLAQMIVDAWVNPEFKKLLLQPDSAQGLLAARGFYFNGTTKKPVVISEDDYNKHYFMKDENEVVFVLPDHDGQCPPGQTLLETAKLLMGYTPNGI